MYILAEIKPTKSFLSTVIVAPSSKYTSKFIQSQLSDVKKAFLDIKGIQFLIF